MTPASSPGRIETLNGVPLYFELRGSGEPLLLLHGFGGCSQDWATLPGEWPAEFQRIIPDMRGHGRSYPVGGTCNTSKLFRHEDAAADFFALLNHLAIPTFKGVGVSGGGNVLLHMATKQPERVKAMVLVSATSYFPAQARSIMRKYPQTLSEADWATMRRRHPGGDTQIQTIVASVTAFAERYDDMNFTPPYLATITARTLIVQGDRDPLYPLEISVEMAKAIPRSSLWIFPNAGHGPIGGDRWPEFLRTTISFLRD